MEVAASSQICTDELEQFCRARSTSGPWKPSLRSISRGPQCYVQYAILSKGGQSVPC